MTRLVLINGAPGSGKSTLAHGLAQDQPLTLALDVDGIKHSLGRWSEDLLSSGLHARRLAVALAREHLGSGHDVIVGQYLARTVFIEELEQLASELGARFVELVLDLDAPVLNSGLVGPEDADALVSSLGGLRVTRPGAVWIDARGSVTSTLDLLRARLHRSQGDCE